MSVSDVLLKIDFQNRFRKTGFIHYNGGLQVHSSLLSIILHDRDIFKSADWPALSLLLLCVGRTPLSETGKEMP
jgi:hypothetical protein